MVLCPPEGGQSGIEPEVRLARSLHQDWAPRGPQGQQGRFGGRTQALLLPDCQGRRAGRAFRSGKNNPAKLLYPFRF
jgi:hypothetical protein